MADKKAFKVTQGRMVILRELEGTSKKWSELRLAYFGPARAKAKASTSFHMQLTKLISLGIVVKGQDEKYSLTDMGNSALNSAREAGADLASAQSVAQMRYIAPVAEAIPEVAQEAPLAEEPAA